MTPLAFLPTVDARLRSALAQQHAQDPFGPHDVRAAVQRVIEVARTLELPAVTFRGGLDVGGAELDHLWAVVDDRVVDVAIPVRSGEVVDLLRRYVGGDLDQHELDRRLRAYDLDWRVLGEFPGSVTYIGEPVLADRVA